MVSIAFLILDDIHHVHHLAPIAFELSRRKEYQCVIYIQPHSIRVLKQIAAFYPGHGCEIRMLAPALVTRIKYKLRGKFCRSARVIRDHLDVLLNYDALISADFDMEELLSRSVNSAKKPLFCCILHGAGDRDFKQFPAMKDLDFVLLSGTKYQQRFLAAGFLKPENYAIIGYPKFDVISAGNRRRLFTNDKPTVIYNTHFLLDISSWQRWGIEILDYFYRQEFYNFIFAPHRNLFSRILKPRCLPKKYFNAPHIHIDLGSEKSVDMTYTQAADIYLGDVSSQVYEFIRQPKPCLFLNAHGVAWRDDPNYLCWQLGSVMESLPDLWIELAARPMPNRYVDNQNKIFNDTFSMTSEPAAVRGANAIHGRLTQPRNYE